MAGVQLDLGQDGLTGGGGGGNGGSGGGGVGQGSGGSVGGGGVGEVVGEAVGEGGVASGVSGSVGESGIAGGVASGIGQGSVGEDGLSLTLLAAGGLIESSLELGLGGGNLSGVLDGLGGDASVDWSDWELKGRDLGHGRGDGEVGGLDAEAQGIGDVVHTLGDAVGINVAVGASHTTVDVADLLLGRVDVGVAVVDVAEFVLSLELAGGSNQRSRDDRGGSQGSRDGGGGRSSIGSKSVGQSSEGEASVGQISIGSEQASLAGGYDGGEDDLEQVKESRSVVELTQASLILHLGHLTSTFMLICVQVRS